jgi:hypothetical protein
MNSSEVSTRFLGRTVTLDRLTMVACVGGGLYFWLARGRKFGELGLASTMSVGFTFFAVKLNNLLLQCNAVDSALLVQGYKIVIISIGFDSLWSMYKRGELDWMYYPR